MTKERKNSGAYVLGFLVLVLVAIVWGSSRAQPANKIQPRDPECLVDVRTRIAHLVYPNSDFDHSIGQCGQRREDGMIRMSWMDARKQGYRRCSHCIEAMSAYTEKRPKLLVNGTYHVLGLGFVRDAESKPTAVRLLLDQTDSEDGLLIVKSWITLPTKDVGITYIPKEKGWPNNFAELKVSGEANYDLQVSLRAPFDTADPWTWLDDCWVNDEVSYVFPYNGGKMSAN